MKTCVTCKKKKPLTDFYRKKNRRDGRRSDCKACGKRSVQKWERENPTKVRRTNNKSVQKHREGKFNTNTWKCRGIDFTQEKYETRLKKQAGVCAICKRPNPSKKKRFALDHNHDTGQVRGVVCDRCNLIVGIIEKDPTIIKASLQYLETWEDDKCQLNSA